MRTRRAVAGRRWPFLVALAAVMVPCAVFVSAASRPEAPVAESVPLAESIDASVPPPDVQPVVFVSGEPYEMGYQYGQQAREMITRNVAFDKAATVAHGSWDEMLVRLKAREAINKQKMPEIVEMWRGIADGAGLDYYDVLGLNQAAFDESACSSFSAWGRATKNRGLIVGQNLDSDLEAGPNHYNLLLVAHPRDGNAFVAQVPAGKVGHGVVMNANGLAVMGSSGQGARPEDNQVGVDLFNAHAYLAWKCASADEARDMIIALDPEGATNEHVADAAGHGYVIEHTSAIDAVRKAGDFGEKDYLIATNGFLAKAMQPAMFTGETAAWWYDWLPRYWTYQKMAQDSLGKISVGTVMRIMGTHNYWDGKKWQRNVWSLEPPEDTQSLWTIDMRDSTWKTSKRMIGVPGERTVYVLQGNADVHGSGIPGATGKYYRLVLDEGPAATTADARVEAELQIWYAARDLDLRKHSAAAEAKFDAARSVFWEGMNYEAKARLSADDENLSSLYYGRAASAFCKAQVYAQVANGGSILQH